MRAISKWLALCVVTCAFFSSCLVIPANYYTSDSRKNISDEIMPQIVPGVTTREDVFLTLGEPDEQSPDERRMIYRWTKVKALWAIGGSGAAVSGTVEKESQFVITIGDDGVVSGKRVEARYKAGQ